jgi:isopenicillin-N epimerase
LLRAIFTSNTALMNTLHDQFLFRPDITYLNFGSFGATPRPVFEAYQRWQLELEREPVQHIAVRAPQLLREAREALGNYVGAHADDLVFTPNPSQAVNIVVRNLEAVLQPGDEILSTDLEYGAMDRTWNYYARKNGWVYRRQHIPLPLSGEDEFLEAFWAGLTPRTKVVFIGQITSTTALVFPVEQICRKARALGLLTIVDGAHVPGHIPLNITALDPDFYTGACHKWMMAPKGCSFLYARRDKQDMLDPLIISWGYESVAPSHTRFIDYHEMQGTNDFSAYLALPVCIEFMQQHNWPKVSRQCRELTLQNIPRFAALLRTVPLAPINSGMFGQMCSLPLNLVKPVVSTPPPETSTSSVSGGNVAVAKSAAVAELVEATAAAALKKRLYEEFKIEVPVMMHNGQAYLRYSIQAFNTQADLDRLYEALEAIL